MTPTPVTSLALATIGIDRENVGYLLDLMLVRGDMQTVFHPDTSQSILRWQPKIISMEVGSNQYHFKNHLEQELKISINGVLTKNISKEVRIREMAKHYCKWFYSGAWVHLMPKEPLRQSHA